MQIDLSIIIVSWNVWDLLRACLASIERMSRPLGTSSTSANGAPAAGFKDARAFGPASLGTQTPTLEVIVVDNASSDATVKALPALFPWVRLIQSATNLGFTAGNNLGYATSRGRTIYFLNPDTELVSRQNEPEGDSLWTLYRALMEEPKAAMVGPQLRYADNTLQPNRCRFPTPLTPFFGSGAIGRYWRRNPWQRHLHMSDWPASFRQEVDWLVGAAILARRDALEEVRMPEYSGPFDEGFFMYSEEVDLCKRLKQAGWRIVYVPEPVVIHYEGRSSNQVQAARDIHYYGSKVRYQEKYFGARWATLLRIFFLWNFRFQLLIEAAKWLLGHRRGLRATRITAYRQVIASKLYPVKTTSSSHSDR
jgi:GT2 family glycosyltransferase